MAEREKKADPRPAPRLYLVTPEVADAQGFAAELESALDAGDVAAVLLRLADADERTQINRVKTLARVAQAHDVALIVDGHAELVARGGADGAHLHDADEFEAAVEQLKPERIAGCGGLATRHDAMTVAERGADYVMFGEPDDEGSRPAFAAIEERVGWWAEVFEAPCVGYAASLDEIEPLVKAGADFVALGDWIWGAPRGAVATVAEAATFMRLPESAA